MTPKELLKQVSDHLEEREALKKALSDSLKGLTDKHTQVNKEIQEHNRKKDRTEEEVRRLIADLSRGLTKDKLSQLDKARVEMETAHNSKEAQDLQKESSELEVPMNDLDVALKSLR